MNHKWIVKNKLTGEIVLTSRNYALLHSPMIYEDEARGYFENINYQFASTAQKAIEAGWPDMATFERAEERRTNEYQEPI